MADSIIITANVTDGAVITSNNGGTTEITANVVTGAKGDKGDTGATGAAGVVQAVTDGTGIDVDSTDPASPIVSLDPASIASLALADSAVQNLSDLSITSTAAELNYTDGVTSAIQTQLDGKSATSHTHTAADTTDFDTEVSNNTDVAANTAARHTHANSAVLDATTASFTTADETKLDGIAAGAQVNTVTSVNTRTGAVTGLAEASDLTAHTSNTSNPHSVTKAQVGLSNADNTSDADKPISTATQTALDGKFTQRTIIGTTNQVTVTNGDGVSGNPTLSLPSAITTPGTLTTTGVLSPSADSTYTLGTSSLYWSNTYTDRLYLNSTAYLDGGTAGAVGITGNVGIGTTTPAHFLDVSKTVNSRTAYGINSTMTASTLQSDVASTGNDETFTNSHYAWSFVASAAHTVGSISVRLKKVGTVTNTTDTIQLKIFSDNAGTPDALLMTTDSMRMGTLTTSYVEYYFGGDLTLVNGTTYWIAVRKSAAVTGGGSIAIDRNGTALTTCNTATPVSGDWTVNAGLGRYTVYGRSPIGIRGTSTNSFGVNGNSTNNIGVYGTSTNYVGVYGTSTNNIGVQGNSTNSFGVQGTSTNSYGVYGNSTNNIGVYGTSTNYVGVYGNSTNSFGVNGNSTNSYGAVLTQSGTLTAANSSNAVLVRRNGVTNSTGSLNYSGNVLQITDNPTGTGTVSGALISGSLSVAADGSGTTERIRFDPRVANGASAVAHMLDTGNALSTAGALLLDVRNNGVSKHAVDLNGNIIEKVPTTPASATAAGVQGTICWDADYVYVCVATNTWKRSALGSW